jgi:hypothetical protein
VPIIQKAWWALGLVWTGAENIAPTGFDPQTVQSVASRHIDYATRPTRVQFKSIYSIYPYSLFITVRIERHTFLDSTENTVNPLPPTPLMFNFLLIPGIKRGN